MFLNYLIYYSHLSIFFVVEVSIFYSYGWLFRLAFPHTGVGDNL